MGETNQNYKAMLFFKMATIYYIFLSKKNKLQYTKFRKLRIYSAL